MVNFSVTLLVQEELKLLPILMLQDSDISLLEELHHFVRGY